MNMKVSCLCPTFNRVPLKQWLLEEAIECFLRQDYQALGVGYRLFLDHYTIHNEETVLYASV
jgi:glycosyltransferase involved in cell wall biosynthesis